MKFKEFVFIDLETTGLDDKKDRIIEVGALKVDSQLNPIARYHTLVNPGMPIPYAVTMLTHGLDDELVKSAPDIAKIRKELLDFIQDAPLIAHNAGFESSFLRKHVSPTMNNFFADTMELFAIFFPSIGSLKLEVIIKELGIRDHELHRAFEDAEDLYNVVLKIRDKIHSDHDWYLVAKRLTEYFHDEEWFWCPFIKELLPNKPPLPKIQELDETVVPNSLSFTQFKMDADELSSLIREPLEQRQGQAEYIDKITQSFNSNASIMIEAGTGIGKTLGYLLPAIKWSMENSGTVVVSTKTKMLQNQVLENDLPKAKRLLNIKDYKAVKVQGRNNYLCIRKMDRFFTGVDLTDSFETKFSKLFFFAIDRLSDVADFTRIPSWIMRSFPHVYRMLGILCADSSSCLQAKCYYYKECHYFNMTKQAKRSRLLVANHSLVMNWPSHLPKGDKIIFDEAHNLFSEAAEATTISIDGGVIKNISFIMDDGSGTKGVISELRKLRVNDELVKRLSELSSALSDSDLRFTDVISRLFFRISSVTNRQGAQEYSEKYILYSPTIPKGMYGLSEMDEWKECLRYIASFWNDIDSMNKLLEELTRLIKDDEYSMILVSITERLQELKTLCEGLIKINTDIKDLEEDFVYWISWDARRSEWIMARTYVDLGNILVDRVYNNYSSCIFTSATLRTGSSSVSKEIGFNKIQGKVISDDVVVIPSPFDYKNHSNIFFMKNTLNPSAPKFINELSDTVSNVVQLLSGRTLVLFSSIRRMNLCFNELVTLLSPKGYKVLKQDMGGDVIEYFMSEEKAVLLGSETLGEGLDIKGEKLSCVILERMPVMMRTPLYLAREDLYRKVIGKDPYQWFELPQRLLKLRQWSGRLIRSNADKGAVVVFDKWFMTQRQEIKQEVINAMSPMPVEMCTPIELIERMKDKYIEWGYGLK